MLMLSQFTYNALYLWVFSQNMPTGNFIRRNGPDFVPMKRDKFMNMYYWMDYMAIREQIIICHKMNNNKEKKIGPYLIDGFNAAGKVCFEYYGCFFHGHSCIKNDKDKDKKYQNTMVRKNYLISKGYKVVEM